MIDGELGFCSIVDQSTEEYAVIILVGVINILPEERVVCIDLYLCILCSLYWYASIDA